MFETFLGITTTEGNRKHQTKLQKQTARGKTTLGKDRARAREASREEDSVCVVCVRERGGLERKERGRKCVRMFVKESE